MNRKLTGMILLLLISLIAFFSYRSNYIEAPIEGRVKTTAPTQEAALDGKSKTGAQDESKATLHNQQEESEAKKISLGDPKQGTSSSQGIEEKVAPAAKTPIPLQEKAATVLPANPVPAAKNEIAAKPIEVSRGAATLTADASKYPKVSKNNGIYGQFHYREIGGGRIEVDPAWIAENIVTITLPGLNQNVQVHKEAADNFIQAFNYIKNGTATLNGTEVPLLSLIRTMNGTWVTRHVNWNPEKGLSNHSWGTAIDINASDHFRYVDSGKEPNDPNLILWEKAFKPAGFSWGNSYADAMHYELLR